MQGSAFIQERHVKTLKSHFVKNITIYENQYNTLTE